MRNFFLIIFTFFCFFQTKGQCINGDLELNSLSGWSAWTGPNTSGVLNLSSFVSGAHATRHKIVTIGNDPLIGSTLPLVMDGSYSLRLGESTVTGATAQIASYTFTVSSDFSFLYALVLQDPSSASPPHTESQRPFFSYWISKTNVLTNSTSPSNLIIQKKFIANTSNPFFSSVPYAGLPLNYKEWQTECVPELNSYVGQTVTIYFATANCSVGGHFGYAYIDGLCKDNDPVPSITAPSTVCNISDPITVSGGSTWNEIDYYWRISRVFDASGAFSYPSSTVTTPVLHNSPVTSMSVRVQYATGGMTIQNNSFYKVTLFTRNCNGSWVSTSKVIKIEYPDLITIDNSIICCGSTQKLTAQIGGLSYGGANYPASAFKWYDEAGTFIGNGSMTVAGGLIGGSVYWYWKNNMNVTPNKSTKYRVVFEYEGCKNEKWVYVTTYKVNTLAEHFRPYAFSMENCIFPRFVEKNAPYYLSCDNNNDVSDFAHHNAMAQSSISYLWNTGETTKGILGDANTDYWVKVTTPCGSDTSKFKLIKFTGPIPDLIIPSGTVPGTLIWYVKDPSLPVLQKPAFNADSYILRIFDRWGGLVTERTGHVNIDGFVNNLSIQWNGLYDDGSYPDTGVYMYYLELSNCTHTRTFTGDITVVY